MGGRGGEGRGGGAGAGEGEGLISSSPFRGIDIVKKYNSMLHQTKGWIIYTVKPPMVDLPR